MHVRRGGDLLSPGRRAGFFSERVVATAHDAAGRVWFLADDGRVAVYDRARLLELVGAHPAR